MNNLMDKAIKSSNLTSRSDGNKLYGKNDFGQWTKSIRDKVKFNSVLDICCGTGNQIVLYAKEYNTKVIYGVDLSKESLIKAEKRLNEINYNNAILKQNDIDAIFDDKEMINKKFDLITCFYGLYYSKDTKILLQKMISHLTESGHIIIVGPYGKNNEQLFSILKKYFKLPDLVEYSSCSYMEKEVFPVLKETMDVEKVTFLNEIIYPDYNALINYWKSSTFYNPDFEKELEQEFKNYFENNNKFIVEKHVMAYIAGVR